MLLYGFNGGVMFNQVDFAFPFLNESGRIAMTDGDKNSVRRRLQKHALPLRFTVGCIVFSLWIF